MEFNIKEGPITMMSLGLKADGTFKFVVAEIEKPGRALGIETVVVTPRR